MGRARFRDGSAGDAFLRAAWALLALAPGCGAVLPPRPATLFTLPLTIEGQPVGDAILDTGGAYELLLRDDFGLPIHGRAEILAFGGLETVAYTREFSYEIGGVTHVGAALIGLSACDCNGVGFLFFRKTGNVLALDFDGSAARFVEAAPDAAVHIPFATPPAVLSEFDSTFIEVEVESGATTRTLTALLDTGTNATFIRGGLFSSRDRPFLPEWISLRIRRNELGTVAVSAGVYETPGLPDLIIGTDVMAAWAGRWYFTYGSRGGTITVVLRAAPEPDPAAVAQE